MADKTVSLEELYKMRGDMAIATLEMIQRDLDVARIALEQIKLMDKHYKLKNDLDSSGLAEIVKTLRAYSPDKTEGKTDEEVLALFGKQA